MSSCGELLDRLGPEQHVVQLYGSDDRLITQNVSRFLSEGLKRGDGILIIATPEHRTTLTRALRGEAGYSRAVLEGRLVFLDAAATLARFMVGRSPDPELFRSIIGDAVSRVRSRAVHTGVRAYGEMVGLLWQTGEHSAAAQLEGLWNELLNQSDVCLFCAYPIDVFGPDFEPGKLDALLCSHTHLLPIDDTLEQALHRAMNEVLEPRVDAPSDLMQGNRSPSWGAVPRAEALVLWLRENLPEAAEQILARAREHYQKSRP
ncbi:MAG TPA: MEDS domain-containing protein [Gemmatimonadales bacterium]|nr:MEDS domain-containing protein [Gemmatimonadales bacterium]